MSAYWSVRPQTIFVSTGVRIDLFTAQGGRRHMDVRTADGKSVRVSFSDAGDVLRIRTLTPGGDKA